MVGVLVGDGEPSVVSVVGDGVAVTGVSPGASVKVAIAVDKTTEVGVLVAGRLLFV